RVSGRISTGRPSSVRYLLLRLPARLFATSPYRAAPRGSGVPGLTDAGQVEGCGPRFTGIRDAARSTFIAKPWSSCRRMDACLSGLRPKPDGITTWHTSQTPGSTTARGNGVLRAEYQAACFHPLTTMVI